MQELRPILLADDNAKDVELALEAFTESNLANRIVVVKDGVEALDYLNCQAKYKNRKPCNPVVILLDIKMPRIDGIEVLRKIRSDEKLKMIPVVILTSSREDRDLFETYRLGVNAYVVKPILFKDFIEKVKLIGVFWAIINEIPPI